MINWLAPNLKLIAQICGSFLLGFLGTILFVYFVFLADLFLEYKLELSSSISLLIIAIFLGFCSIGTFLIRKKFLKRKNIKQEEKNKRKVRRS